MFSQVAWSHPLGNFSLNHYTVIEAAPGGVITQHVLDFAEIPSYNELANLDTDGDNKVTPDEMAEYKAKIPGRYLNPFTYGLAEADGSVTPLVPQLIRTEVVLSRGQGSLTCLQIQLACSLDHEGLKSSGEKRFVFADRNLTHMRGVREIRVLALPGAELKPEGIQTPESVVPIPIEENLYVVTGLEVAIQYRTGEGAPVEGERPLADITRMMDPRSIPQYPLETDEAGNYAILKSPIQPDQEVQAKISTLQPRTVVSASDIISAQPSHGAFPTPPQPPGGTGGGAAANSPYTAKQDSGWTEMIGAEEISPSFVAMALFFSVLFGASHALSPGHGKTVVAAYLVGSRGTVWHAIFLGLVVTFTHISSVLLLGLITLYFSQYVVPDKLIPLIEAFSGLLIVFIGAAMFLKRYGAYQRRLAAESLGLDPALLASSRARAHASAHSREQGAGRAPAPDHPHPHPHPHPHEHGPEPVHPHNHDHNHEQEHGHSHPHEHDHTHEHGHEHSHPHEHPHEHPHNHPHNHPHEHGHDHAREPHAHGAHAHGHGMKEWLDHEHGPGTHTHDIPADATWRDLLVLGITGGMVPCPSAIVVLIAAVALQRILFGLLLIVFFSIGLATVLIAIGILMVTAKKFMDRIYKNENKLAWLQIISPVLVTLLGIAIFLRGLQAGGLITFHF